MQKINEFAGKIAEFIKTRKGYCLAAAALVLVLAVFLANSNIETVGMHNANKKEEAKERQEILEQLEEADSRTETPAVGQTSMNAATGSAAASGSGVAAEGNMAAGGAVQGAAEETNQGLSSTGEPSGNDMTSVGSSNANAGTQNTNGASSGMVQTEGSSGNSSSVNGSNNSSSAGVGNINEGSQPQNPSPTTDSGQSSGSSPGQGTEQGGDQSNKQEENDDQSQAGSNTDKPEESEYIAVTLKIICDKVLNHPDLSTSASLPSDGVILNVKTVVKRGQSVLDALKAACADHGIAYVNNNSYISSIGGLSEKECGRYSGWKFKVNGVVSGYSSNAHKLNDKDEIVWYYATTYNE